MMDTISYSSQVPVRGQYDVIVAGGGVAGCAAALEARRLGKRVLLVEKAVALGGLATIGLINLFVPMCNGRGVPVIRGMGEEFLRLSIRWGYDTLHPAWRDGLGGPQVPQGVRYATRYSAPIFSMALTDLLAAEGVELLFDSVLCSPVMEGRLCRGIVVLNKSGLEFYGAKMLVDATGDADLLYRAGVPTRTGGNYHTYTLIGADMTTLRETLDRRDFGRLQRGYAGGVANLYGGGHPQGKPYWTGLSGRDVSDYEVENQREALEKLKGDDRSQRDVLQMPTMPQMRTTRRLDGDYTLDPRRDMYQHFDDSVCAINDFDQNDYLYEVPLRCLTRRDTPNLVTAGRSASGRGYAWDILRVIPPAILTGQAAGAVCAHSIDQGCGAAEVDIARLQGCLEEQNGLMHFDDDWIPRDGGLSGGHMQGHL